MVKSTLLLSLLFAFSGYVSSDRAFQPQPVQTEVRIPASTPENRTVSFTQLGETSKKPEGYSGSANLTTLLLEYERLVKIRFAHNSRQLISFKKAPAFPQYPPCSGDDNSSDYPKG